ncbi:MAG: T9SS type A sorting domain-containing protein [Bacteroidia bacterium]
MKLNFNSIRYVAAGLLLICLSTANLRAQWQAFTPVLSDTIGISDLRIAQDNDSVAWAVAMKYDVDSTQYGWVPIDSLFFVKTADAGATWSGGKIPLGIEPYASNICPISADEAWVTGIDADYFSYIMHTTDGGLSWQRQFETGFAEGSSYINLVHFWDAQHGVAMGDPAVSANDTIPFFEIYTTSDGGQNWTRTGSNNIPAVLPDEYGFSGNYFVSGETIWFSTFNFNSFTWVRAFRSTDRGLSWTASDALAGDLSFADSLHGVGSEYGEPSYLLRYTADGGTTWTDLPEMEPGLISSLVLIPESYYILAVVRTNNITGPFRTIISTDLGTSWTEIGTSELAGNAKFRSPRLGYAGEWQPSDHATRMYKYAGSPLTGLFSGKTLQAQVIVAPNPTADILSVFIDADQPADYTLLLNDAAGRLITRLHLDKAAQGSTQLDLRTLPAGIYTLTVSSEKGYATKRVVKQ